MKEISKNSKEDLIWGVYNSLYYAWSSDKDIRFQSSTGGLLNGISLYLLETNNVDFILHTAGDPDKPMRSIPKFSYSKKDLLNCQPAFDLNSMPADLNQLRIKGIGEMDDEPTMGDVLDACVDDNFSRISTEMTTDAKEKLKKLSEQKGITMGELIEEMMDVYQKTQ